MKHQTYGQYSVRVEITDLTNNTNWVTTVQNPFDLEQLLQPDDRYSARILDTDLDWVKGVLDRV
jgi:hypothetical protein